MPSIESGDTAIYYEVHGEGPTIVFAHGVGGNHASWYQQIPTFADSYRVVTFDHRGFGRSDDPSHRGRDRFVDDLECLFEALEIEKAALIGQSMGGGTVLNFTHRNPDRVAALVLADTLYGIALPEAIDSELGEAREKASSKSQAERVFKDGFAETHKDKATLYRLLCGFNQTHRENLTGGFERIGLEALSELPVPALFIVGEADVLVPPALVRKVQAKFEGSFLVEIADSGHSAYFEQPIQFNDSVLSFLQAVGFKGRKRPALSNAPGYTPAET